MGLNIKVAETHEPVQELAALTGETQTTAVTIVVRERLDRVRSLREVGMADRLLAIGADTAPRLREQFRSADHGDLLYDQQGFPRDRRASSQWRTTSPGVACHAGGLARLTSGGQRRLAASLRRLLLAG